MLFANADDFFHLFGVAFCQAPPFQVKVIFKPHSAEAVHQHSDIAHLKLFLAGGTHRPHKSVTQNFPGRVIQKHQVVDRSGHAAQNAKHKLEVNRFFNQPPAKQKSQVIEHAGIINFKFGFGIFPGKKPAELTKGFKRIGKNKVLAHAEVFGLPIVFKLLDLFQQGMQGKIQRTGVERGQLRGVGFDDRNPLFDGHAKSAAGGGADNRVAPAFYLG